MAQAEHFSIAVGETLPYGLWLVEMPDPRTGDPVRVAHLLVLEPDGSLHGLIVNETTEAVSWARERLDALAADAVDRTHGLVADTDGGAVSPPSASDGATAGPTALEPTVPLALEREGFVQLGPAFFRDAPVARPAAAWRAGLALPEVHAGYAVERYRAPEAVVREADGAREDGEAVAREADDAAEDGEDSSLEPDGHIETAEGTSDDAPTDEASEPAPEAPERGDGSTATGRLERSRSGDGAAGSERSVTDAVRSRLETEGSVVILGPPGSGKSTVCKQVACEWYEADRGPVIYRPSGRGQPFRSVDRLVEFASAGSGQALVVVEDAARPESLGSLETLGRLAEDPTVSVLLDSRESEWRGLDVPDAVDPSVVHVPALSERDCEHLLAHFRKTVDLPEAPSAGRLWREVRTDAERPTGEGPHGLLRLTHRLASYADPLGAEPTALEEEVARMYRGVADDPLALSAHALASALVVAGLGESWEYLYALGRSGDLADVEEAIATLEGAILLPTGDGGYRPVHESVAAAFLAHLLRVEDDAPRRFGDAASTVLALADDADRRARIAEHCGGERTVGPIRDDPGAWADRVATALYGLARTHPRLAPLFGDGEEATVSLPVACSETVRERWPVWLGWAFVDGGRYEEASRSFERLPEDGRLGGERRLGLGHVALEQGAYDEAARLARATLERAQAGERAVTETGDAGDASSTAAITNAGWSPDGGLWVHDGAVHDRARFLLGKAQAARGDYDDALEHFEDALSAFRRGHRRRWIARTDRAIATVHVDTGAFDRAEAHFERARELSRALGNRRGEASALAGLGNATSKRGDHARGRRHHREALAIRRELGLRPQVAQSLNVLGLIASKMDRPEEAVALLEESLEIKEAIGDREGVASTLNNLGTLHGRESRFDEAHECFTRSLEISEELGIQKGVAHLHHNLGHVESRRGALEAARDHYERSRQHKVDMGDRAGQVPTLNALGFLALQEGAFERARGPYEEALDLAEAVADRDEAAIARARLAEVTATVGEDETARELLAQLEAAQTERPLIAQRVRLARARANLALGDLQRTDESARGAMEALSEIDSPYWLGRSLRLRARVASAVGDTDRATALATEAVETFEAIGAAQDAIATIDLLVALETEAGQEGEPGGEGGAGPVADWSERVGALLEDGPDELGQPVPEWFQEPN